MRGVLIGFKGYGSNIALSPKERIVGADSQDAKRLVMEAKSTPPVPRDGARGRIDRRRLVVTGLTAPVVLTLGSRSAQAQSHGGSTMSSIADPAKKQKK